MNTQNDHNRSRKVATKAQEDAQTKASTGPVNPPTNIEDMELNEEQLDIISGGADGPNPWVRG